jgi:phage terminase large subunit-like protein
MKDLVVSSQGMRQNPHCCIITTAGFDLSKPCYNLRSYCLEVLAGVKEDDSLFAAIYELDEGDDYTDEVNWPKSNPALGSAVRLDFIREQVNKARNNPSDEVSVKTKTLNIWCQSADTWITENTINKSTNKLSIEDFKDSICYIGVDLAAVSDLTAVSVMIPHEGKYYFMNKYYLPQSALEDKSIRETYKLWNR